MENSPRLTAALEYAAQGLKIFPCRPGTKFPAIKNPFGNATTDPEIIRSWFGTFGDCNIAFCPEDNGRGVADVDIKNGKEGLDNWLALPFEKPPTLTISTPSGGLHFHYKGSLPQTVGKLDKHGKLQGLAVGVDTRGRGSLALLPPSITPEGQYQELIPMEPAELPAYLAEWDAGRVKHRRLEAPEGFELDLPLNVQKASDRLRDLAKAGDVAVENQGGNDRTYKLAVDVLDYGVSPWKAVELISEHWNPHCDPPWSDDELGTFVENALKYRQNEVGCRAYPDYSKYLEGVTQNPGPTEQSTQERRKLRLLDPVEAANRPPLEFWDTHRAKPMLPRMPGGCALIAFGASGSHKTGVVLKELVDAMLNRDARVLYIAAEGEHGISTARLPALVKARGKTLEDIRDRWRILPGSPNLLDPAELAELIGMLQDFKPALIAVDTWTRCLGAADINSPTVGTLAVQALEVLGAQWDATVIGITHPGKDIDKGAIGSRQFHNQAYAEWIITYDDAGTISVLLKKMKDGEFGFTTPLRVNTAGVPVVVEMSPDERAAYLRNAQPRHDDMADAVWRIVYPMIQTGEKVTATNRGSGYGPRLIAAVLRDQGFPKAEEKDAARALAVLQTRGKLAGGDGDGYQFGPAAIPPDSLH
ncbi:MAG: bifunctional DNA primase/polymerase [Alphaproteobacteria bacterium]